MHHAASGRFAIRKGDWVLIDGPSGDDNGPRGEPQWLKQQRGYAPHAQPGELFDLRRDLPERSNLYAERPAKVRELGALLERYKQDGRSTPGARQKNDVPIRGVSGPRTSVAPSDAGATELLLPRDGGATGEAARCGPFLPCRTGGRP